MLSVYLLVRPNTNCSVEFTILLSHISINTFITLGIVFTYVLKLNLVGIWWGLTVALLASLTFQFGYIYWRIDWEKECVVARERVNVRADAGRKKGQNGLGYREVADESEDSADE